MQTEVELVAAAVATSAESCDVCLWFDGDGAPLFLYPMLIFFS